MHHGVHESALRRPSPEACDTIDISHLIPAMQKKTSFNLVEPLNRCGMVGICLGANLNLKGKIKF
jgi:hypothetical protein